jgi:hypothetical protein
MCFLFVLESEKTLLIGRKKQIKRGTSVSHDPLGILSRSMRVKHAQQPFAKGLIRRRGQRRRMKEEGYSRRDSEK